MKKLSLLALLFVTFIFNSCSSDEETQALPNFKINGVTFELDTQVPNSYVLTNLSSVPQVIGGQNYTSSSISIVGKTQDNTKIGSLAFRFMYKPSQGIAGTYVVSNYQQDLESIVTANQRAIIGWVSMANVNNINTPGSFETDGNDPVGSVQVINNGNNNYTIKFNGIFRKYNNNFQVQSSFPVQMDLTATATVNNL